MIIEKNWNKIKKSFIVKNINEIQFPKLSMQDLELLTVGSYQLKQGLAYAIQHIATNEQFEVEMYESQEICRIKLQSRHRSNRHYKAYVKFNSSEQGLRSITSYACNCQSGRRTVGMCSHTTCLIWYLGHGRYHPLPNSLQKYKDIFPENVVLTSDSETEDE